MGSDGMALVASRFEVHLVRLDPTVGREIRKVRPCVIISPDEMNRHIGTVIVAPMTTRGRHYPTRVSVRFRRRAGQIVLDQILSAGTRSGSSRPLSTKANTCGSSARDDTRLVWS